MFQTSVLFGIMWTCSVPLTAAAQDAPQLDLRAKGPPPHAVWVDRLEINAMDQDRGRPTARMAFGNKPITIDGIVYPHGVGTQPYSEMEIDLKGAAERFAAEVGIDDSTKKKGSVIFEIWTDGKKVADSGLMQGGQPAKRLSVDLRGVRRLRLVVNDGGDGTDNDHADWAGALIVLLADTKERPAGIIPGANDPVMSIASGSPLEPQIHGPRVLGTTPGHPFIFLIPATGEPPLTFSAEGLPEGLKLNEKTGIIAGSLPRAEPGGSEVTKTIVTLKVANARGQTERKVRIVAGRRQLAMTPPMGWNSWNIWACAVDDARIRAAADAMVANGLAAHGFQYINIDDCWEGKRNASGEIQANEKFPDMKALGEYIHSKGLRFGIYSSPGPKTCAGYEASYQHEEQDARTWAKWGVDYVKYDWCSYRGLPEANEKGLEAKQKPYRVLCEALDKCDRDIVFSFCQYGMGEVWKWGAELGGNLWRTTGDIRDTWNSMSTIGFDQNKCAPYAGPGHWNDPDMLVVGKVGWGPNLRETGLTPNEQITHITLWSLLAAPLLIGCDMTQMSKFTIDLLTNEEVLDVDQDPLGKSATLKARRGQTEIWARPLYDGTMAVGLFNRGRLRGKVTVSWSEIGMKGSQPVRDLWQRKDLGNISDEYTVEIPRHGAMLLKVGRPPRAE